MQKTTSNSSKPDKLFFGLICNSIRLERWQAETLKLLQENNIILKLVILNNNPQTHIPLIKKLISYPYKNLFFRIYNRYFLKPSSKKGTDISNQIEGIDKLKCKTEQKGYTDRFSENDVKNIKSYKLDFILRFGFNIIRGEILNSCKYGIWSFHHDDEQKYRGGPPGFWEIHKNDDVNGVILQKLTDKLDAGIILKKGYYKIIKHSYSANIDRIYYESMKFPLQVCKNIRLGVFTQTKSRTKAPIYNAPGNFQMIWFWLKILKNKFHFHLTELFLTEDWNTGIIEAPVEKIINSDSLNNFKIIWFPKLKKSVFSADPFIFTDKNGNSNVIFEDYDYRERKGKISAVIINNSDFNPSVVINKNFHLAFPFVFNYKDELFCIPESFENNQISLYKYNKTTQVFNYIKPLIENIEGVDPILFRHDKLWWLFFTKKDLPSVNLYAYYSNEFDRIFKPHKNNPVKIDIRSARSAGAPFIYNDNLCRPTQDCSKTYGEKININKIEKLTPFEFSEKIIHTIYPVQNSKFNKGIHTINSNGKYSVIDGKRFIFVKENFFYQLRHKTLKFFTKQ